MIPGDNSNNFPELYYSFQDKDIFETEINSKAGITFVESLFETETSFETPINFIETVEETNLLGNAYWDNEEAEPYVSEKCNQRITSLNFQSVSPQSEDEVVTKGNTVAKVQKSTEEVLKSTETTNLSEVIKKTSKKKINHLKIVGSKKESSKGKKPSKEEFIKAVNNVIESANGEALSNTEIVKRLMKDVYPETNKNALQQRVGRLHAEGKLPRVAQKLTKGKKATKEELNKGKDPKEEELSNSEVSQPVILKKGRKLQVADNLVGTRSKPVPKEEFNKAVIEVIESAGGKKLSNSEVAAKLKKNVYTEMKRPVILKRVWELQVKEDLATTKKIPKEEFIEAIEKIIESASEELSNSEIARRLKESICSESTMHALIKRVERLRQQREF